MRFQVPQFIDVEDKIFGPLTFKQFIYVAGAIGLCVVFFTFLNKFVALLLSVPVVAFGVALAFYKMNNQPFIQMVENFFHYSLSSKLYLWQKEEKAPVAKTAMEQKPLNQVYVPKLSESKLRDLSWSLDIKENQNPVTKDTV